MTPFDDGVKIQLKSEELKKEMKINILYLHVKSDFTIYSMLNGSMASAAASETYANT